MKPISFYILLALFLIQKSFSQIEKNKTYSLDKETYYQITFYENVTFERYRTSRNDVGYGDKGAYLIIRNVLYLNSSNQNDTVATIINQQKKNPNKKSIQFLLLEQYKIIYSHTSTFILKPKFGKDRKRLKFYKN